MDMYFVLSGIPFVWNDDKAKANSKKHDGISFQQAAEAFFDPFLVVVEANRNDKARDAVIALDKHWHCLFVVYIELENDMICLISDRKVTRQEREHYET